MENSDIKLHDHIFNGVLENWQDALNWQDVAALAEELYATAKEMPNEVEGKTFYWPGRPRVFHSGDWLDDEVPIEWLADLLALIHATPHLDWLLLSKHPQNWRQRIAACDYDRAAHPGLWVWIRKWLEGTPPANVWIGTSVEDQKAADLRIPQLLAIPAKVRFLSCEPLLGPVRLDAVCPLRSKFSPPTIDALTGDTFWPDNDSETDGPRIHWVIAGGESGPGARPMQIEWAESLAKQCKDARVAFFMKQLGGTRDKRGDMNQFPEHLRVREFPSSEVEKMNIAV